MARFGVMQDDDKDKAADRQFEEHLAYLATLDEHVHGEIIDGELVVRFDRPSIAHCRVHGEAAVRALPFDVAELPMRELWFEPTGTPPACPPSPASRGNDGR